MRQSIFLVRSVWSAEETIARIGELFRRQGVQCTTEGLSIVSIRMPIPVGSSDRIRYSNRNWVGLNPFTFISGIHVRCQSGKSSTTEVTVQVNRFRALIAAGLWFWVGVLTAATTARSDGTMLFTVVGLAAWFGLLWFGFVSFLGGYLIKKEITDCLNA